MEKKTGFVIFNDGVVETLAYFGMCIAKELVKRGYPVYLFKIEDDTCKIDELKAFIRSNDTVLITFNFNGIQHEAIFYDEKLRLLWDLCGVRVLNIIVDNPLYYLKELSDLPKRYAQICIDIGHEEYMKTYYPAVKLFEMMPIPGSNIFEAEEVEKVLFPGKKQAFHEVRVPRPLKDRKMQVMFAGNYTHPDKFEEYIKRLGDEYEAFYRGIIEDLVSNPKKEINKTFREHIEREMGELSSKDMVTAQNSLMFIDLYVRFYFRGLVIKTLTEAGIKVDLFGEGFNALETSKKENLIIHGGTDTKGVLYALEDTVLSLNVMPWFKRGAHDRVYSSMLSGAVALTDESIYMKDKLRNGEDLFFYSLDKLENLPDIIKNGLSDMEKLQNVADSGYRYVSENADWSSFTEKLLKIVYLF
ncbi:MAG: glycosyltransferase family 1 protein [Lachnospiraceae bacterium]|nr:glycosyltransferase family 1 protein [Lachnospiraceae bacterium]